MFASKAIVYCCLHHQIIDLSVLNYLWLPKKEKNNKTKKRNDKRVIGAAAEDVLDAGVPPDVKNSLRMTAKHVLRTVAFYR